MTATADLRPRRLVLTVDELEVLRASVGALLPADFTPQPAGPPDESAVRRTLESLTERGLAHDADGETRPHRSLAMDLAVLSAPEVALHTHAGTPAVTLTAYHAVAGAIGAGLVTVGGGAVELSMFPAAGLRAELARVVPPVDGRRTGAAVLDLPYDAALQALTARARGGDASAVRVASAVGLPADDLAELTALDDRFVGGLRTLVRRPDVDGAGVVVWVAAAGGWHALEAALDGGGAHRLVVRAVEPADLGASVAPLLAAAFA